MTARKWKVLQPGGPGTDPLAGPAPRRGPTLVCAMRGTDPGVSTCITFCSGGAAGTAAPRTGCAHGEGDGEGCHKRKIHDDSTRLARAGGPGPRAPRPGVYLLPILCAWRGWIVLDNEGGWRPAADAELGGR